MLQNIKLLKKIADAIGSAFGGVVAMLVSRAPDAELPNAGNSSTTPLAGGATFTGTAVDVSPYDSIHVTCQADVASAASGLVVEFSPDGTNWDYSYSYTLVANILLDLQPTPIAGRYMRVRLTNGAGAQASLALTTTLKIAAWTSAGSFSSRNSTVVPLNNGVAFTGTFVDVSKMPAVSALLKTDKNGVLQIQWSQDGTNVCIVDELDMPALKASNLVAWEQSQKEADVPATWRNKAGAPLLQYAGYEMAEKAVSAEVEAVETPKVR